MVENNDSIFVRDLTKPKKPTKFENYLEKWQDQYIWALCEFVWDEDRKSWREKLYCLYCKK